MTWCEQSPEAVRSQLDRNVGHLAITWALIIPLIYFAGAFWFQKTGGNDALSAGNGALVETPQTAESAVTVALVFAILAIAMLPRMKSAINVALYNRVFVALAALAFLSSSWSQDPVRSLEWSVCLAFNTLFAFYLCRRFSPEQQMRIVLLLGGICLALSICLALVFPRYGISNLGGTGAWRGAYGHKNICALITTLLLSAGFYVPTGGLFSRLCRLAFIVLSVLVVLMTQSATGKVILVCLAAYLIATKAIKRFRSYDRLGVLVVSATIAAVLVAAAISHSSEITYALGKDPTLTGRTEIWQAATASALKHPILGYGYMAFWRGLRGESANVALAGGFFMTHAHSGFLEVWLTLGLCGVGLFMYSVVKAFRDWLLCLRGGGSPYLFWCGCVVFLTIISNAVEAGGIASANNVQWILYILACVGLSDGARRIRLGLSHG